MKARRSGRTLLTALLAVAALTTAACGSNGNSNSTAAKALQTVTLGVTSLNSLHLWVIVAKDENLMAPYGIQLDIPTLQSVAEVVPALLGGSLDFGLTTPESLFAAQNKAPSLQLVAAENTTDPYSVVARPDITSLAQLQGKSVGVDAAGVSADYISMAVLMADQGLDPAKVHFVNAGAPATRVAAMTANQVQAVMNFPPAVQVLTRAGMHVIANTFSDPNLHGIILSGLVANKTWYAAHKSLAVNFMKGYLASVKWLYDPAHRAKAIQDIAKEMNVSQSDATATFDFIVTQAKAESTTGLVTEAALAKVLSNDAKAGVTDAATVSSLPSRFDDSLLKAA